MPTVRYASIVEQAFDTASTFMQTRDNCVSAHGNIETWARPREQSGDGRALVIATASVLPETIYELQPEGMFESEEGSHG